MSTMFKPMLREFSNIGEWAFSDYLLWGCIVFPLAVLLLSSLFNIIYYLLNSKELEKKCQFLVLLSLVFVIVFVLLQIESLQQFGRLLIFYPLFVQLPALIKARALIPTNKGTKEKVLLLSSLIHLVFLIIMPIAAIIFVAMNG